MMPINKNFTHNGGFIMIDVKMLIMIFFINFAYVTLNTLRFMLTMKGYRILAPLMSMVEITIYILGLSMVLDRLDNPINFSPRKTERTLYALIKEIEARAFIISYEPKYISGGFWTKKVRKRQKAA